MRGRRLVMAVAAMAVALAFTASAEAQIVDQWNQVWLDSIRESHRTPGPTAREGAILHASIQDAINSITRTHQPLKYISPEPVDASPRAAANAAAHRVLTQLYPERQDIFDATLSSQLSGVANSERRDRGLALGREVADALIANRRDDGSDRMVEYTPTDEPGRWRPTTPDFTEQPYNPEWPRVTPWTMVAGDQFRPPPPPELSSERYAESLNEVKAIGARDSAVRTAEQTEIALFWANDRQGTFLPIGQLNHITQVVARDQDLNTEEQARLFALTNIAMADAGIVAWDSKYHEDLWRPVTAIREADSDGNPATEADADWLPLFPVSPPFPAYVSGHATFSAAHAAVMEEFFGTDDISFTITTDEPLYLELEDAPEFRTYDSFSEAALENAMSRVFLGVHFDFDGIYGNESGDAIGRYAYDVMTQPIPEPTTGLLAVLGLATLGLTRRTRRGRRPARASG